VHADPAATPTRWRVSATLPVLKLTGAVLLVAVGLLFADGDPVRPGLAALAAAGLLIWGLRDLVAPVRLAVDPAGITVISGYAGQRRIDWAEIERIRVDSRPRLGLRTEMLEIDTADTLHLFGRYDLGAAPDEVAAVLQAARARANPPR
jgi:hypothetical protein